MSVTITVAKSAGLCYGIRRALGEAEKAVATGRKICTYGELLHNHDVIARLRADGIGVIHALDECPADTAVVIRSHGVPQSVYDELAEKGLDFIDATCPDVRNIHKIVAEQTARGAHVIVAGDPLHPEVVGIIGHANPTRGSCTAAENLRELEVGLERFTKSEDFNGENALILVAQTTFDRAKWQDYQKFTKNHYTKAQIFDTICRATINRKEEAVRLARESDLMVVLGGPHSSNSQKLAEACREHTETVFAQNAREIDFPRIKVLLSAKKDIKIGITAGASTPADLIKEVHSIMSEEMKNDVMPVSDADIDFMAEVDKTFKRIYIGNRVKAHVVAVGKTEAVVDIGTKHSGYIPADELSNDPGKFPADVVNVGDVIDCIVTSINDAEGVVYLSKKRVDAALGLEKIGLAAEMSATLTGTVTAVVKGGVIVVCEGVRVFVPASQSGVPRNGKLEELQKKQVKFKVIEVNEGRGRVVGSIKAAAKEENDALRAKFWEEIEEGKTFHGEVKSIESYGVFVDLGGVDGMVHLSELSWSRIKHPKEVVAVGDKLDVYVKSFDTEKRRVSLGAKDPNDNPWTKFLNDFEIGDDVKVQVVSITPFGAFAQIIPGVDGLIHISQISAERVTNVAQVLSIGEVVDARITEIDAEKNRVSLSMKALLDAGQADDDEDEMASGLVYSDDDVAPDEATGELTDGN